MWYKCLVGHKMQYFVIIEKKSNARRVAREKKNKRIKMGLWGVEFSIYNFFFCAVNTTKYLGYMVD